MNAWSHASKHDKKYIDHLWNTVLLRLKLPVGLAVQVTITVIGKSSGWQCMLSIHVCLVQRVPSFRTEEMAFDASARPACRRDIV